MDSICHKILAQGEKNPSLPIFKIIHTGGVLTSYSYQDVIQNSLKVSHNLKLRGIKKGDIVFVIFKHGIEQIYSYLGSMMLGAIPAMVAYPTERMNIQKYESNLKKIVDISSVKWVCTYPALRDNFSEFFKGQNYPKHIFDFDELKNGNNIESNLPNIASKDAALLQYSSGSTGYQKGICLAHEAILNQVENYSKVLPINSNDRIVSWLPLYHDMGLMTSFLMPIILGIETILMSPFDWIINPKTLFRTINEHKGTLVWMPNFAFDFCAKRIKSSDVESLDLSCIKSIINCSEPISQTSHQKFLEKFKQIGIQENKIGTCYAMAENTFAVTQNQLDNPPIVDEVSKNSFLENHYAEPSAKNSETLKFVSSGNPLPNVSLKIVDQNYKELSDRHVGEILIRSDCLLQEFFNEKERSQKQFKDGYYCTGDIGYKIDDELFITARKKDIIIVGGKNIYPQNIEEIVNEVEGTYQGRNVCLGLYNEDKGTEDLIVIVEVKTEDENERWIIEKNIRAEVSKNFDITIQEVILTHHKWLMKTSSGKIARKPNLEKLIEMRNSNNSLK